MVVGNRIFGLGITASMGVAKKVCDLLRGSVSWVLDMRYFRVFFCENYQGSRGSS